MENLQLCHHIEHSRNELMLFHVVSLSRESGKTKAYTYKSIYQEKEEIVCNVPKNVIKMYHKLKP